MPKVKIEQPKQRQNPTKMPAKFIATGIVRGKQTKLVKGELEQVSNPANKIPGKLVAFRSVPVGKKPTRWRYRWVLFFDASAGPLNQEYKLTVTPVRSDGTDDTDGKDTVQVKLVTSLKRSVALQAVAGAAVTAGPYRPPTVDYPPEEYEVAGSERDVFYAFGASDQPIAAVTIGGRAADYTHWLPSPDYFWWSEFYGLGTSPGEGDYELLVTSADGSEPTEVSIEPN